MCHLAIFYQLFGCILFVCHRTAGQTCNSSTFQCVSTGDCIPNSYVCNYNDNCGDNSDEQGCSYPTPDMNRAVILTANDQSAPVSRLIKLFGNPDDYVPRFANFSYYQNELPVHINSLSIETYDYFHAVDISVADKRVYFGDNRNGRVSFGNFIYNNDTSSHYYIGPPISKRINGMAFDWLSRNVYWTDDEFDLIAAVTTEAVRSFWNPIIDSSLTSPEDVVVDPIAEYLFWSDGFGVNVKIERSDLVGNNRVVLRTQGLVTPTTLSLDYTTNRLYWLDSPSRTIGVMDYDGVLITTIVQSTFNTASSFTILQSFIFVLRSQTTSVTLNVHDRSSGQAITSISFGVTGTGVDTVSYSADRQPTAASPCKTGNGGCDQFCWTTSATSRLCDCSIGFFKPTSNSQACVTQTWDAKDTNYILLSDVRQQNIYQLRPDTGELRAVNTESIYTTALAMDRSRNMLYIVYVQNLNSAQFGIRRRSLDGSINNVIHVALANSWISDLAVDTSRNRLYFTDSGRGTVAVMASDGSNSPLFLLSDTSLQPNAIAFDQTASKVYWTDCSPQSSTTIQTVNTDDVNDRQTLVTDSGHLCISALDLDINNGKMYWAASGGSNPTIEMANLDGSDRTVLATELSTDYWYTGITVFNTDLFVTDNTRRYVIKLDLNTRQLSTQLPPYFANLTDVYYESTVVQPTTPSITTTPYTKVTPATSTSADDSGKQGTSQELIIGVAAGVGGFVVLVVTVIVVTVIVIRRKSSSNNNNKSSTESTTVQRESTTKEYNNSAYSTLDDVSPYTHLQQQGLSRCSVESQLPPPPHPYSRHLSDQRDSDCGDYLHVEWA